MSARAGTIPRRSGQTFRVYEGGWQGSKLQSGFRRADSHPFAKSAKEWGTLSSWRRCISVFRFERNTDFHGRFRIARGILPFLHGGGSGLTQNRIASEHFDMLDRAVCGDDDFQTYRSADRTFLQISRISRFHAAHQRSFSAARVGDGKGFYAFHTGAGADISDRAPGPGHVGYDFRIRTDGFGHQAFAGKHERLVV